MIVVLLAVLGVPIWLVLGALAGALWSRRRFLAQPDVFRVRERHDGRWPRRDSFGRLVHEVLVVTGGVALVRTSVHGISAVAPITAGSTPDGLDALFRLDLDDGSSSVVAVDARAADRFRDLAVTGPGPVP